MFKQWVWCCLWELFLDFSGTSVCFSKQVLNLMVSTSPFFSPLNPDNPGRNALSLLAYNPAAGVISSPLLPYLGCVTEIRTARLPRPGLMLPAPMQHYRVCGGERAAYVPPSHTLVSWRSSHGIVLIFAASLKCWFDKHQQLREPAGHD